MANGQRPIAPRRDAMDRPARQHTHVSDSCEACGRTRPCSCSGRIHYVESTNEYLCSKCGPNWSPAC
jgi:hypothetical protein